MTRADVLFHNAPMLTAPPSVRGLPQGMGAGSQTRLLRAGDQLFQINTSEAHQVDTVAWQDREIALDPHPDNTAIYNPATVTPDGHALYVSQSKKRILSLKDGEVRPLFDLTGANYSISSDLTVTPQGTLYFGTNDAQVHIVDPNGQMEFPARLPYRRSGLGWAFAEPQTILPGRNGNLFVGTFEGVVGFDANREALWVAPMKTTRACFRDRMLESADGSKVYYTGADHAIKALDAKTGKVVHEHVLVGDQEGDSFNQAAMDKDGNLYTVSSAGILFKLSPELDVLWKKPVGAGLNSAVTSARVAFDRHGNVCVNPNTESFHVYSPDGLLLLEMKGPGVFAGGNYAFDFTLSEQGDKAYIMSTNTLEGKYQNYLVEVGLPGRPEDLLAGLGDAADGSGVRETPTSVLVGGTTLPRRLSRTQSAQSGPALPQAPERAGQEQPAGDRAG